MKLHGKHYAGDIESVVYENDLHWNGINNNWPLKCRDLCAIFVAWHENVLTLCFASRKQLSSANDFHKYLLNFRWNNRKKIDGNEIYRQRRHSHLTLNRQFPCGKKGKKPSTNVENLQQKAHKFSIEVLLFICVRVSVCQCDERSWLQIFHSLAGITCLNFSYFKMVPTTYFSREWIHKW